MLGDVEVENFFDSTTNTFLPIFTIYKSPPDYPNKFVVRLFETDKPTKFIMVKDSIKDARNAIPFGKIRFGRDPKDDVCIVETYI